MRCSRSAAACARGGLARQITLDAAARRRRLGTQADHRLQQRRTVGVKEERLGLMSRALPHISSLPVIMSDIMCSIARNGLSAAYRTAILAHRLGPCGHRPHQRIPVRKHLEAKPVRMHRAA